MPELGPAEHRYADIAAQSERLVALQRQLHVIGLAAIRIVDPAVGPARRIGLPKTADDLQAADRPPSQGGIGVAVVDIGTAIGAQRGFLPDDPAAQYFAAIEDFDGAVAVLGEPDALRCRRCPRRAGQ